MLKTSGLSDLAPRLGVNNNKVVRNDSKADKKNLSKKSKNVKSGIQTYIETMEKPTFLTLGTRKAFNSLRQAFTKALIF